MTNLYTPRNKALGTLASEPPEWFNDPPRKVVWFDTLPDVPRNLLYWIDSQAFATYVGLIVRHREAVLTQRQLDRNNSLHVISPCVRIVDRCIILMRALQQEMGFTPSARARIIMGDAADVRPTSGPALSASRIAGRQERMSIDVHFHIVPILFLEALRRGDLQAAVQAETQHDCDTLTFHAPPHIVLEPGISVRQISMMNACCSPHWMFGGLMLRQ
jgi:hypothetical protein